MGRVDAPVRIDVHVCTAAPRALPDDVLDGLTKPFKELPPKHLYDARGEELRTEISAKFTRDRVAADFAAGGLALAEWFTDHDGLFALSLASPE